MSPLKTLGAELSSEYTVERELTGGGMARVFVALDARLGRRVVIKILPRELAQALSVERFRREIRVGAMLQHPNIVPVLNAGETDGLPYLIMPYVEGESLRGRLAAARLSIVESVGILRDVARALAFAHERGIVHRDVKPDNILLSSGAAVVADFGVARAIQSARRDYTEPRSGTITAFGTTVGTPAYMAPEQIAAGDDLDHRVDIYAFGIMAFEMLSGRTPFHARSHQSLLVAHLTETPPNLNELREGVPPALARLIARCLEKHPERRPQSVREIIAALDDPAVVSGEFVTGSAATGVNVSPRRRHGWMAGIALFLLVTVAALGVAFRGGGGESESRAPTSVPPATPAVAVLPLVYLGSDTLAYMAEGFASDLTTALAGLPGVRVASHSAAGRLQQRIIDGEDVASSVAFYLEGVVQREGNRVRVDARLINAADGMMLWGESYEGRADSLFALQDQLSASVLGALRERLNEG